MKPAALATIPITIAASAYPPIRQGRLEEVERVDTGGFTAAATRLGVTKSAVSKRIAGLEEQLGVRLFQRAKRPISLTEAGERFRRHAASALEEVALAERAATELQQQPRGALRVSCLMSFGRLHVARLLPAFLKRYPNIHIDLILDDRFDALVEGDFDVALRAGPLPDSSYTVRKLASLKSVLCASPEYLKNRGCSNTPDAVAEHNCLAYSYSSAPNTWTFNKDGEASVVQVTGNFTANNGEALCEVVLGGAGVARLAEFVAAPFIASGRLVPLLASYSMPTKTLHAVFPERRYLPQKVRVFVDYMANAFTAAGNVE